MYINYEYIQFQRKEPNRDAKMQRRHNMGTKKRCHNMGTKKRRHNMGTKQRRHNMTSLLIQENFDSESQFRGFFDDLFGEGADVVQHALYKLIVLEWGFGEILYHEIQ